MTIEARLVPVRPEYTARIMDHRPLLSTRARSVTESPIRQMGIVTAERKNVISFAPGYPDPAVFPWEEYREIAASLFSGADGRVLQYGPTQGHRPLREWIAGLQRRRGIDVAEDQILITSGSQQGLDLLGRVLVDPGDVVLVELPSYTGAISAFANAGARFVGVAQTSTGIDADDFEAQVLRLRRTGATVKFLYLVPTFQNPTGRLTSPERRRAILDRAARLDVLIVEDDPYCELYFDEALAGQRRPLKADDEDGRVVYLSSFSKTLSPAHRVAWLVASPSLVARLDAFKQASDLCTSELEQRFVLEIGRRGSYEQRLPHLRAHYRAKRDALLSALNARMSGELDWDVPEGGFFVWARLPQDLDAGTMLDHALAAGVIYVVGSAFFVDGSGNDRIRLAFSLPTTDAIEQGVDRLAGAITALRSSPGAADRQGRRPQARAPATHLEP